MKSNSLNLQQLDRKVKSLQALYSVQSPPSGWIKAIRTALGMSLEQLGNRLSITKQSARALEMREQNGSITLKYLRDTANVLDMHLVYGFVPKDGSLEALIDRKAKELATIIVMRTSNTMKLEGQENTKERIEKAIEERANAIKIELPKTLWD